MGFGMGFGIGMGLWQMGWDDGIWDGMGVGILPFPLIWVASIFGTVHKAIWKDGYIKYWDSKNDQWKRKVNENDRKVALKCLNNSQDITVEFLEEVRYFLYNLFM